MPVRTYNYLKKEFNNYKQNIRIFLKLPITLKLKLYF